MTALRLIFVLFSAFPAAPPKPFEPLPALTDKDLASPNHVLTPANKAKFTASESLPVGDFVLVVLPVREGTTYRWKLADPVPSSLEFVNAHKNKPDIRQMRKEFAEGNAPFGRVDALQVFKFKVSAADPKVALKFRLQSVTDGAPSDKTFEVVMKTGRP